ncbi:hypothetical protein G4B88_027727 [Cannabis sativa]|uniref:Uncharacterized protein n=1 Tax=Cannabis sativa TaxID=3483 RepID=A0A7J6ERX7_CANSA|nr:hypothetical protein G4B88_027727 [Cannabis sativa]
MLRSNMSREGHEENFLGVVKHLNLVKLVGYCAKHDERGIQRLLVIFILQCFTFVSLPWRQSVQEHKYISK